MIVMKGNVAEFDEKNNDRGQPYWIKHEDYEFGNNCFWKKYRWNLYFNGWTINKRKGQTIHNATYPTEDEACFVYANRRIP